MAQDFAKQRTSPGAPPIRRKPARAASKAVPSPKNTHWSWYFSGLMSGVILAIAGYLSMAKQETAVVADTTQPAPSSESPAELPTFNFGFYDELANAEVAVNVTPVDITPDAADAPIEAPPATSAAAPVVEEKPVNYLLQVGSFQNRGDAENHRARVILLNMDANISAGVVSGRTFYRVQVGPFAGRGSAEEARDVLSENNIDSIPLLMR